MLEESTEEVERKDLKKRDVSSPIEPGSRNNGEQELTEGIFVLSLIFYLYSLLG